MPESETTRNGGSGGEEAARDDVERANQAESRMQEIDVPKDTDTDGITQEPTTTTGDPGPAPPRYPGPAVHIAGVSITLRDVVDRGPDACVQLATAREKVFLDLARSLGIRHPVEEEILARLDGFELGDDNGGGGEDDDILVVLDKVADLLEFLDARNREILAAGESMGLPVGWALREST